MGLPTPSAKHPALNHATPLPLEITMTNRRAHHHLTEAAYILTGILRGCLVVPADGEPDDPRAAVRWHLFQARFARLSDTMPVYQAFPNAVHWAAA